MSLNNKKIAVVIPSYKVIPHIIKVLEGIPEFVDKIYVIDDCCPQKSGEHVQCSNPSEKVVIYKNEKNLGVGGAVCSGYRLALRDKMDIIVKLDGDGQMDPHLIKGLIQPLLKNDVDYVKGSRFYSLSSLAQMPTIRLLGNTALSFINKFVTGYWDIMDPTNGFTAISSYALSEIPLDKIENRYFFESDILFRLSLAKARVEDFMMDAKYGEEVSNLSIKKVLFEFPPKYASRFLKRILYSYFLRDFNFGSLSLCVGFILTTLGILVGGYHYIDYAIIKNIPAPTGMIILPALAIGIGTQFFISFFHYDINSSPKQSITSKRLKYEQV